jgi:hypothetical protein
MTPLGPSLIVGAVIPSCPVMMTWIWGMKLVVGLLYFVEQSMTILYHNVL